jgi:hypothetical protein
MAATRDRRRPIIALTCLAALATGAAVLGGGEQAQPRIAADPKREGLTPFIYGARGCAQCHTLKNRAADTQEERDSWICRMDEFPIFDAQDKHKIAFKGLTGLRGQEMSQRLGTDVTKLDSCVNCHSVPERGIQKLQYVSDQDGVTCVACHGMYREWVTSHQIPGGEWSRLTRDQKEQRFGMTDLWNPVRRAETCASCHIGNHAEGKVITHAMYAAGHPPLPSFEAATFCNAQPRHWEYLREKSPGRLARLSMPPDLKNLEQTQLVVIAGLVNLRESMRLIADEAEANKPDPIGARWPDFARFDCFSCHHELRPDDGASWRQVRRRGLAPGRPTSPDWPLALIRLAISIENSPQAESRQAQFERDLAALNRSLAERPYGEAGRLASAARGLARWADSAIQDLSKTVFDAAKARTLLDRLSDVALVPIPDDCGIRLMSSLKDVGDIPKEGRNVIILASVDQVLHFRIFDGEGKIVADTDEPRLVEQRLPEKARRIEDLKKQLKDLWPPHELTKDEKDLVITSVISIINTSTDFDSARQNVWAFRIIYREVSAMQQRDPAIEQSLAQLETALAPDLSAWYRLRLLSSKDNPGGLPQEAKDLIVLDTTNGRFQLRVFDSVGSTIVDTDEAKLKDRVQKLGLADKAEPIETLKVKLKGFSPSHPFTPDEQRQILDALRPIVGPSLPWSQRPTDFDPQSLGRLIPKPLAPRDSKGNPSVFDPGSSQSGLRPIAGRLSSPAPAASK